MSLAEAMAVLALAPGSRACHIAEVDHDDPVADRQTLEELARYCRRFAPLVALETVSSVKANARAAVQPGSPPHALSPHTPAFDGVDPDRPHADCLHLDVTGTAGFFGGEAALARTVTWTLAARGVHARVAIADTPAAAWAAARHTDLVHEDLRHADRPRATDRPARRRTSRRDSRTAAMSAAGAVGRPIGGAIGQSIVPRSGPFRHRRWAVVPAGEQLQLLAGLPTSALRLDAAAVAQLAELGVDTIGGVARLPRKSLASRFDPHVSQRLAEFTGGLAEPLAMPSSAELPTASHAFDFPVLLADATTDGLLEVVERLVRECIGPLAACGKGVVSLQVRLDRGQSSVGRASGGRMSGGYDSCAPVVIDVGVFQPTASARHLVDLVRLRMARMRLPREIEGIVVEVVSAGEVVCRQRTLFGEAAETSAAEVGMLLDRLSGRLGRTAVFAPVPVADAQPEHAWAPLPPAHPSSAQRSFQRRHAATGQRRVHQTRDQQAYGHSAGAGRRPIWMLPQPVRLEVVSVVGSQTHAPPARFRFGARMHDVVRAHGPERIETAWWRGPTVRRDYYVVETRGGGRHWIFRRLGRGALTGEWFLHGTFS
jgi:protein ImuB